MIKEILEKNGIEIIYLSPNCNSCSTFKIGDFIYSGICEEDVSQQFIYEYGFKLSWLLGENEYISLDKQSAISFYKQLTDKVYKDVVSGCYPIGARPNMKLIAYLYANDIEIVNDIE